MDGQWNTTFPAKEKIIIFEWNTLWSYFYADISVTACNIHIKLYTIPLYVKCEVLMQRFENWTCWKYLTWVTSISLDADL